jgi:hypothetical protein
MNRYNKDKIIERGLRNAPITGPIFPQLRVCSFRHEVEIESTVPSWASAAAAALAAPPSSTRGGFTPLRRQLPARLGHLRLQIVGRKERRKEGRIEGRKEVRK